MSDCCHWEENFPCKFQRIDQNTIYSLFSIQLTLFPYNKTRSWFIPSVQGLRLDVSIQNRVGLLSDITRVFRENGLSISRAEVGIQGEKAIGTFYVKDASGQAVNPDTLETVRREIGGTVLVANNSSGRSSSQPASSSNTSPSISTGSSAKQDKPVFSLGSLLWSQVEWLSSNFRPIKS